MNFTTEQIASAIDELARVTKVIQVIDLTLDRVPIPVIAARLSVSPRKVKKLYSQGPFVRRMVVPREIILQRAVGIYTDQQMILELVDSPLSYNPKAHNGRTVPSFGSIEVLDRSLDDHLLSRDEYEFVYRNARIVSPHGDLIREPNVPALKARLEAAIPR